MFLKRFNAVNHLARTQRLRGFSLIEILVVLTLIGVIVGMIAVAIIPQLDKGKRKAASSEIGTISQSLDIYKLESYKYPTTAEGLEMLVKKSILKRLPKDPWGNDYVYLFPGEHNSGGFDLSSYGPDGVESEDDINNWSD